MRLHSILILLALSSIVHAADKTTVTAALDVPHEKGKNIVWCNTFQLAWDTLGHGFCGEALRLEGTPPLEKSLNATSAGEKDIDADSVFVKTGIVTPKLLEDINATLKKRFGDNAPKPLEAGPGEQAVLAYAFLFKNLAFKKPFERQRDALKWLGEGGRDAPLQAFGIMKMDGTVPPDVASQVQILHEDRGGGGYIIELKTASRFDRLILAQAEPKATLKETLDAVRETVKNPRREPFTIQISDQCVVPNIHLALERNYDEILNRKVLNDKLKDGSLAVARQDIRFDLDEKGTTLKSSAELLVPKNGHAPRGIVFDRPFLLYMERSGAMNPYLVIWFENAELFVKAEK